MCVWCRDACCICYHLYSTLVCVLFGTAIPTSFCNYYICFFLPVLNSSRILWLNLLYLHMCMHLYLVCSVLQRRYWGGCALFYILTSILYMLHGWIALAWPEACVSLWFVSYVQLSLVWTIPWLNSAVCTTQVLGCPWHACTSTLADIFIWYV